MFTRALGGRLRLGLTVWAHMPEHRQHQDGKTRKPDNADESIQSQSIDECHASTVEQRCAKLIGELCGHRHRTAEGFLGGPGRFRYDAWRQGSGQLAAVDGKAEAAKDREAKRPTELSTGFRKRRRRPCPLRRSSS